MHIGCIGLVGKENDPLFLRVYKDSVAIDALTNFSSGNDEGVLRYHYIVYCSLDMVDERHKQPGQNVAPTTTKIVVAVEEQVGTGTAQPELQVLCKQIHQLYANQLQNPFAVIGERVSSPRFQEELDKLVKGFNSRN